MKYTTLFAACAPLLVAGKPMAHERLHHHHIRDAQITTSTSTVWEETTVTIDVTVTVYAAAGGQPAAKAGDVHLDQPNKNLAVPTPAAQAPPVQAAPAKPTTTPAPPPVPSPSPQPAPQQPAPQQPAPQQPAPQQPAPQQPAPVVQQAQAPSSPAPQAAPQTNQGTSGSTGGSAPSGGACGEVGGKCMASDVTIYNDQGTGACGWNNDTNTQDYFALAFGQWGSYTNDAPGPHKNKLCGRMASITAGGKTVSGMLTDKCPGCTGWSIDLSLSLWNKLFNGEAPTRKYQIEWSFTGPEIYSGPGY